LKGAGKDVELTEYANASHAFDNPLGAQPAAGPPKFESVRDCTIQEGADGVLINPETQRAFTYKDSCVVHGPHLGYDPAATKLSKAAVKTFLRTALKLE
jgi:dienelactone hydrolase